MSENNPQGSIDEELEMLEVRISNWQPRFWDAEKVLGAGTSYLEQLAQLLCNKFGQRKPVRRCAVALKFPQNQEEVSLIENWREQKTFEAMPLELKQLSAESMIFVIQVFDKHFLNIMAFTADGERALFTYHEDHPDGLYNKPPKRDWRIYDREGDNWDSKLKGMTDLRSKSDLYQVWSVISLLRLIKHIGTNSEEADILKAFFDNQDAPPLSSVMAS